ncbi:protein Niprotein NZ [Salmonella enterica]|nr:protein Niprotein NZ [Salmonella enterica]
MTTVTSIGIAQQRQKDREMLETIDWQLQTMHEAERRLMEMRRELVNRLGINKPDGDAA